jgi:hypothetical protein
VAASIGRLHDSIPGWPRQMDLEGLENKLPADCRLVLDVACFWNISRSLLESALFSRACECLGWNRRLQLCGVDLQCRRLHNFLRHIVLFALPPLIAPNHGDHFLKKKKKKKLFLANGRRSEACQMHVSHLQLQGDLHAFGRIYSDLDGIPGPKWPF